MRVLANPEIARRDRRSLVGEDRVKHAPGVHDLVHIAGTGDGLQPHPASVRPVCFRAAPTASLAGPELGLSVLGARGPASGGVVLRSDR
jgi:hypothetical protein